MKITLKLIANYRKLLPEGTQGNIIELDVPYRTTPEEVLGKYDVPLDSSSVILVNGHVPNMNQELQEGDVVSAFPAMAGGCLSTHTGKTNRV